MISFVLKKVVALCEPLGLMLIALLWLAWWLRRQGLLKPMRRVLVMTGLFCVVTCLPTTDRLLASIENPWRSIAGHWDELPVADAIFCLGGGANWSTQEIIGVDLINSSDRPTTAIELLRLGKAPLLVVSGGMNRKGGPTEAEAVQGWIAKWKLASPAQVEIFPPCVDTHDEAVKLAAMAKARGWKKILLVTSASHMKRAVAVVRKPGAVEVVPVPCGFQTRAELTEWVHLPDPNKLTAFSTWWHEIVGWWVYRARGWV